MMTSLNETKRIEEHLIGTSNPEDILIFDAQLILDKEFTEKVEAQKLAYETIQQYGRKQLKNEIKAVHQKLFSEPNYKSFRKLILRLFKKP